jgi:1-acylglycerone phosphate reductase
MHPPASGSVYEPYRENIVLRLERSQAAGAMPTEEAARIVADAVLKEDPPKYLTFAPLSTTIGLLRWLPRAFLLDIFWKKLSKVPGPTIESKKDA